MPWNPEVYNQFKNIRYRPFFDLMDLISAEDLKNAVDIGCGTGEQTKILSEKFGEAQFLGIDSSAEMLAKSKELETENLHFELMSVENFVKSEKTYDLIFSNAALQWSDDHETLFPKLLSQLSENGQFAVQMPMQSDNILNQLLLELASKEPFKTQLNGFLRKPTMLSIDDYVKILFDGGLKHLDVSIRVYPIIAEDAATLLQFISGSALIPYFERLTDEQQEVFSNEFKVKIQQKFGTFPAIYPFKRLLMYGRK